MRKKLLECDIHGSALFKCKRRCWKSGGKKDISYANEYTEKCFKCISEGRYKKGSKLIPKKKTHVKIK